MKFSGRRRNAALGFPNLSRDFDEKRNRVCFWGYDSVIEISFFVETSTLRVLFPQMNGGEAGILQAFDSARERIQQVAQKLYLTSRDASCTFTLAEADF